MEYDFEKIGRQSVLDSLTKKIKDVADYLQDDKLKLNKANKLKALKDLETIANDAYKILSEL